MAKKEVWKHTEGSLDIFNMSYAVPLNNKGREGMKKLPRNQQNTKRNLKHSNPPMMLINK